MKLHINETPQVAVHRIKPDDEFPNNECLPVVHYKTVFTSMEKDVLEREMKKRFEKNNWTNTWVDSIYQYHHYHSNTHEVLGVCSGHAKVQLGGPDGVIVELMVGDVLVLPAGVAHKNVCSSPDFTCVGAYPDGIEYDIKKADHKEFSEDLECIKNVPLPETDPIFGKAGYVLEHWMINEEILM